MSKVIALPGLYKITVENDGEVSWIRYYDTALEAAEVYVKFVDHGMAEWERVVTLESPDGSSRTKRLTRIGVAQ